MSETTITRTTRRHLLAAAAPFPIALLPRLSRFNRPRNCGRMAARIAGAGISPPAAPRFVRTTRLSHAHRARCTGRRQASPRRSRLSSCLRSLVRSGRIRHSFTLWQTASDPAIDRRLWSPRSKSKHSPNCMSVRLRWKRPRREKPISGASSRPIPAKRSSCGDPAILGPPPVLPRPSWRAGSLELGEGATSIFDYPHAHRRALGRGSMGPVRHRTTRTSSGHHPEFFGTPRKQEARGLLGGARSSDVQDRCDPTNETAVQSTARTRRPMAGPGTCGSA